MAKKRIGNYVIVLFGILIYLTNSCFAELLSKTEYYEIVSPKYDAAVHLRIRRDAPTDQKTQYQSVQPNNPTIVIGASTLSPISELESSSGKDAIVVHPVQNTATNRNGTVPSPTSSTSTTPATPATITANDNNMKKLPTTTTTATTKTTIVPITREPMIIKEMGPLVDEEIDVSEDETEKQLQNQNLTMKVDYHAYYNSTIYVSKPEADEIWQSIKNIPENPMLSNAHRRAMTVDLGFLFPFYGHYISNVTIATGGFLYTGEYVHSWLAATQYIAPLMANFDTSKSNDSFVRYEGNGTAFTVLWENAMLQDNDKEKFTFSATLHKNGDIVFAYFNMPTSISSIRDVVHPVKVGLSDAYIIDKAVFFTRRKTIYEYHRVTFENHDIINSTIIYLKALPTCLAFTECAACVNHNTGFECVWCPQMNRCSAGTDRRKQEWTQKGCDRAQISEQATCPALGKKGNNANSNNTNSNDPSGGSAVNSSNTSTPIATDSDWTVIGSSTTATDKAAAPVLSGIDAAHATQEPKNVGVAFGFLVPICLVSVISLWIFYAYRNPHTKSGQLLIQYRPSQWSWRRGEARYTAATIHM